MTDTDLKQYLELLFAGVRQDVQSVHTTIARLSVDIARQGESIHKIETAITNRIVKVETDLQHAFEKIRELSVHIEQEENNRVQSDITFAKRLTDGENEQKKKWESQIEVNKSVRDLTKVLWAIFSVLLVILVNFVWEMIKSGGLQGMNK